MLESRDPGAERCAELLAGGEAHALRIAVETALVPAPARTSLHVRDRHGGSGMDAWEICGKLAPAVRTTTSQKCESVPRSCESVPRMAVETALVPAPARTSTSETRHDDAGSGMGAREMCGKLVPLLHSRYRS